MEDFINQLSQTIGITPFVMTLLTGVFFGFMLGKVRGGVGNSSMSLIEREMTSQSTSRSAFITDPSSITNHTSLTVNDTNIIIESSLMEKVIASLNKKNKIEAIKILREEKNLDLKTAKNMVDFIEMRAPDLRRK